MSDTTPEELERLRVEWFSAEQIVKGAEILGLQHEMIKELNETAAKAYTIYWNEKQKIKLCVNTQNT